MSDDNKKPDLKLLKFEPVGGEDKGASTSNEWAAKALRNTADQLMETDLEVGSVGIAVAFQNGITLSTWVGGAYPILLVGALASLQQQVLEEGIKDNDE